jgi:glycosyltransferase involved in cell wall biosynthesis
VRIGPDGKGIGRALENIAPLLVERADDRIRYVALTTTDGSSYFPKGHARSIQIVPRMFGSVWEQFGLPYYATKIKADLIYRFGEVGPRWGPPYVLHLTEDPQVRWSHDPKAPARERMRRRYEGAAVRRSLHRARLLLSITRATGARMENAYGLRAGSVQTGHLGVNKELFNAGGQEKSHIFHLGSDDPRDNTKVVALSYRELGTEVQDLPPLVIGGELGSQREEVASILREVIEAGRCSLPGRVSDDALAMLYRQAILCIQPSSHEGFGLQQLEALAAGAPLIVSQDAAVLEVVGGAAHVISKPDAFLLSRAMQHLLGDAEMRELLSQKGLQRATALSWTEAAETIHAAIHQVQTNEPPRTN